MLPMCRLMQGLIFIADYWCLLSTSTMCAEPTCLRSDGCRLFNAHFTQPNPQAAVRTKAFPSHGVSAA